MVRYLLIFMFISLLTPYRVISQEPDSGSKKYPFVIGLQSHYGSILIHSQAVRQIQNSYPLGLEIDISWHKNKEQQWNNCHCYPRIGLAINYFYYDNPEVLGNGIAAVYYVEPFFRAHKKLSFSVRAGMGITYLTNPYDEVTNPTNQSYSTPVNAFQTLNLALNYKLNKKVNLNLSANYNHLSNGGVKVPNKGINFPSAGLGFDYIFNPQPFLKRTKKTFKDTGERKQRLGVDVLGFLKSYRSGEATTHLIWGGSVNYSYQIGKISALTTGAELIINGVVREELRRKGIQSKSPARVGLLLGHEFLMGRYRFSTQMGIYAYRPYRDNNHDLLYQRYKLTYTFSNGLYIGGSLKAHRHVADYMDFRLGYSLEKIFRLKKFGTTSN